MPGSGPEFDPDFCPGLERGGDGVEEAVAVDCAEEFEYGLGGREGEGGDGGEEVGEFVVPSVRGFAAAVRLCCVAC